jgi:hypothetical protein
MSFIARMLRKAGLLNEIAVAPPSVPTVPEAPAATRIVTLQALVASAASRPARDLPDLAGLRVPLEQVLEPAGNPAWTVDRALSVLRAHAGDAPASLARALAAEQVSSDEVLKDALRRDELLDRYEREVVANVERLQLSLLEEARQLEAELAVVAARLASLREGQAGLGHALDAWIEEKSRIEHGWAEVVEALLPGVGGEITMKPPPS